MYGDLIDARFLAVERVLLRRGLPVDVADVIMEHALSELLHAVQLQERSFDGPKASALARWTFKLPGCRRCPCGAGSDLAALREICGLVASTVGRNEAFPVPYVISQLTTRRPPPQALTRRVREWFLGRERAWGHCWPFWTLSMQRTRHPEDRYPPDGVDRAPACRTDFPWPDGYPIWRRRELLGEPVVERGRCGARRTHDGAPCQTVVSMYGYDYCRHHGGCERDGVDAEDFGCVSCRQLPMWPARACPGCGRKRG